MRENRVARITRGAGGASRPWLACLLIAPALSLSCASGVASVQRENAIGQQYQSVIRQQNRLLRDPVIVNYVRKLGRELAEHAAPSPYNFKFYVVNDVSFNAFAIPGGYIYINTGTILKVADEAQLAGIVAHEIGHVTARHIAKAEARGTNTRLFTRYFSLITYVLTGGAIDPSLLAAFGEQGYLGTYSRDDEREADALGLETLAASRYDPEGLVRAMQTIQAEVEAEGGGRGYSFLRTHPVATERIENLQTQVAELGGEYTEGTVDEDRFLSIQRRVRLLQGVQNYGSTEEELDD